MTAMMKLTLDFSQEIWNKEKDAVLADPSSIFQKLYLFKINGFEKMEAQLPRKLQH